MQGLVLGFADEPAQLSHEADHGRIQAFSDAPVYDAMLLDLK